MKATPYSVGRKWFCNAAEINGRTSFHFVIVGPGSKPDRKRCRLEGLEGHHRMPAEGQVHEYTHKHLKKYGTLVPE